MLVNYSTKKSEEVRGSHQDNPLHLPDYIAKQT